jgi:hypothetical protein
MGNPGTNIDFAFFQNRMVNPYRKFSEPGFPHNFAKNDRHDLKIGCTDASRRQLQSVLEIGGLIDPFIKEERSKRRGRYNFSF